MYPEGEKYLSTDVVFGVKTGLIVVRILTDPRHATTHLKRPQKFQTIDSDAEAKKRGFPKGGPFKLVEFDVVLLTREEAEAARKKVSEKNMLKV